MDIMTAGCIPAKAPATMLMVLLHGYGADGVNLIDLGRCWSQKFPQVEYIAPNAPFRCEQGMGYQWASLRNYQPKMMAEEIKALLPHLKHYLDSELQKRSLTYQQLILMGFSQGAYLALHAGLLLTQQQLYGAGILAYAGWMIVEDNPPSMPVDRSQKFPPVLLIHGTKDTVVPLTGSLEAAKFLTAQGFQANVKQCINVDHSISLEGIQHGQLFLETILSNFKT